MWHIEVKSELANVSSKNAVILLLAQSIIDSFFHEFVCFHGNISSGSISRKCIEMGRETNGKKINLAKNNRNSFASKRRSSVGDHGMGGNSSGGSGGSGGVII